MSLTQKINQLSWGQIIVVNSAIIMLTIALVTQQYISAPTTTTSKATPPPPTPIPNYPAQSPQITSAQPIFAKPGDDISIQGNNFGDYQWDSTTTISSNPTSSPSISLWSNQRLNLAIPENLPPNQITNLTITINNQSVSTPISIYDSNTTQEFGLNQNKTEVYVNHPRPNSYVILATNSPVTPTESAQTISSTNNLTFYTIPLNSNTHTLLTSKTPITITHLIPVTDPTSNTIQVPYFIKPNNPLFNQSQSLKSSLAN